MRLKVTNVLKTETARISRIMLRAWQRWKKNREFYGAADGTRTRNSQLGRLMLYQLNYRRKGKAKRKMVGVTGFEPATHCSQSSCATKLRYTPSREKSIGDKSPESKKKLQSF